MTDATVVASGRICMAMIHVDRLRASLCLWLADILMTAMRYLGQHGLLSSTMMSRSLRLSNRCSRNWALTRGDAR
ncbi:hypothetical protein BGC31_00935 [Komagataeibacter xylinus]|nr:hypothetical protein BGC31_00935 [Komagataeibacter xylinus]